MIKKWIAVLCMTCAVTTLQAETKVLAFAGSTREGSYNKALVHNAAEIAREMGANVTVIDLKDYPMPFYDADLEASQGMPENAKKLRKLMIQSDAIFIASPQYNASVTAVLKNAIDWTSRSEQGGSSREAYNGKKFAIMSTSPGNGGGAKGLTHLRQIIRDIRGEVIAEEVVVPKAGEAFDANGNLKNQKTINELKSLVKQSLK